MTNTKRLEGAVTDYGSSMVQWMRHRQPKYKGGVRLEVERPSPSYIVDVCNSIKISFQIMFQIMFQSDIVSILDAALSCPNSTRC